LTPSLTHSPQAIHLRALPSTAGFCFLRDVSSLRIEAVALGKRLRMSKHLSGPLRIANFALSFLLSRMKDAGVHVVQVRTDGYPRGELQLWFAAEPRDKAVNKVLSAVPEGWTARLTRAQLALSEVETLQLPPGTVRQFLDIAARLKLSRAFLPSRAKQEAREW
jgi:hypothetical protein